MILRKLVLFIWIFFCFAASAAIPDSQTVVVEGQGTDKNGATMPNEWL